MDYLEKIPEFEKTLTLRRQIFVRNLLLDPQRNATQAAIKSGYAKKSARTIAAEVMADPKVKLVLKKYDQLIAADNENLRLAIIKELSLIAFSDVKTFLSWANDGLNLKDSKNLPENVSRVVEEVSETLNMFGSSKKIKLHSKLMALKELNKMHGFYAAEKVDHTNSDGTMAPQITVTIPSNGREKQK